MRYKRTKLVMASILMAALSACANLNRNDLQTPQKVSTGDLKHPIQTAHVSNSNRNLGINPLYTSTEIQSMNNGFITIDQNSYSTDVSSQQFPHSRMIQKGQTIYYTFEPAGQPQKVSQPGAAGTSSNLSFSTASRSSAVTNTGINRLAMQVIELTNNERRKNGLAPLATDPALSRVAQTKTNEMNTKHYFSHTSPSYGSPFDMMRDFGVTYRSAGENIAMGQTTAKQVVTAWMNSEGHRKNMLSPNFTSIGVGYTAKGNYWSQMFIGK